jgi:hypothetical protein
MSDLPSEVHATRCPYCEKIAIARIMGRLSEPDEDVPVATRELFLLECSECGKGSLFSQYCYEGEAVTFLAPVWPLRRQALSNLVPEELRREHQQAVACLEARAHTAVVVMVRRTLEGMCQLNGAKKKILAQGLKELHEMGKIDDRLLEWANELRVIGNEGAHFTGRQVSREDAEDALDLAEAMLEYIYVFAVKFNNFKERRKNSL